METENQSEIKRSTWPTWMHVAGVAYPVSLWLFVVSLFAGTSSYAIVAIAGFALTIGTVAFIGGIGRYLATKR